MAITTRSDTQNSNIDIEEKNSLISLIFLKGGKIINKEKLGRWLNWRRWREWEKGSLLLQHQTPENPEAISRVCVSCMRERFFFSSLSFGPIHHSTFPSVLPTSLIILTGSFDSLIFSKSIRLIVTSRGCVSAHDRLIFIKIYKLFSLSIL